MQRRSLFSTSDRFCRDRGGVTAVEFALLGAPFFMLTFAIIETAVIAGAGMLLDSAVDGIARRVMTGDIQTKNIDATAFRKLLCDDVGFLLECSRLKIDLRTFATSAQIPSDIPLKLKAVDSAFFCFDPGAQESITVFRAFYEWPWVASFLRAISSGTDGNAILFSMAAFMNEPYGTIVSTHSNCV